MSTKKNAYQAHLCEKLEKKFDIAYRNRTKKNILRHIRMIKVIR